MKEGREKVREKKTGKGDVKGSYTAGDLHVGLLIGHEDDEAELATGVLPHTGQTHLQNMDGPTLHKVLSGKQVDKVNRHTQENEALGRY